MKRRTPLRATRKPRSDAERLGRRIVRGRSDQRCEVCGVREAAEWHHRKRRSQLGDWSATNGLDTCSPCHRSIHAQPERAYANGWMVRESLDPAAMPAYLVTDYGHRYVWLRDNGDRVLVDLAIDFAEALHAPELYGKDVVA